jgi:CRISPR system Cascade subunit CasD
MPCFLTFTLAAPLASFGGVAVGERRGSDDRPAKSAIIGLLAAALGIEREDEETHAALAREFFCAVRIENFKVRAPRRLMTDYHTAQSPPRGRNQRFATRRHEVADKLESRHDTLVPGVSERLLLFYRSVAARVGPAVQS